MRKNSVLTPGAKICISKNMALIFDDFRPRPCFYFFEFCIFYAKHCFYAQEVRLKNLFFCSFPHPSTMTKSENRDFAFVFSEKSHQYSLKGNPFRNCSGFNEFSSWFVGVNTQFKFSMSYTITISRIFELKMN